MTEPTYTEYVELRKSDDPPPPAPQEDSTRFYADEDGALRSMQSDGTDAAVGGGGSLPVGGSTGQVLTKESDADGDAGWETPGAVSGVITATVPLSSADILALGTDDVVLVAGTPGFVTMVAGPVLITYFAGETPYQDNGGQVVVITRWASNPINNQGWTGSIGFSGFWDTDFDQYFTFFDGNDVAAGPISDLDGQDVTLALLLGEGEGSPTLGDGTMKVTLSYFLAPAT